MIQTTIHQIHSTQEFTMVKNKLLKKKKKNKPRQYWDIMFFFYGLRAFGMRADLELLLIGK